MRRELIVWAGLALGGCCTLLMACDSHDHDDHHHGTGGADTQSGGSNDTGGTESSTDGSDAEEAPEGGGTQGISIAFSARFGDEQAQCGKSYTGIGTSNAKVSLQDAPANRWFVHLGSTGCTSAAPGEPPAAPCLRMHRPTIEISDFDPLVHEIVIDASELLSLSDVRNNTPDTPPGCMSGPADAEDCAGIFTALGINVETGECISLCAGDCIPHCDGQTAFRAELRK